MSLIQFNQIINNILFYFKFGTSELDIDFVLNLLFLPALPGSDFKLPYPAILNTLFFKNHFHHLFYFLFFINYSCSFEPLLFKIV